MDRLKGKTILLGKEPGQGRLLVAIVGGKTAAIGSPNSVPNSVSRCKVVEGVAHAKINIDQNGNMILTNLKPQNVTFVNGSEIVSKRILQNNTVELGKDRYSVSIPMIIDTAKKIVSAIPNPGPGPKPEPPKKKFNISHLKGVWERYEQEIDRIAQQQQETGKKRMLPIMVGSLSGVASPILAAVVAVNTLYITVPVAAISFGLYFVNYKKKDTSYEERKAATEKFTDEYVCPNPECNKFLGNISYKLLKKQYSMQCPYCKSEFVEN